MKITVETVVKAKLNKVLGQKGLSVPDYVTKAGPSA